MLTAYTSKAASCACRHPTSRALKVSSKSGTGPPCHGPTSSPPSHHQGRDVTRLKSQHPFATSGRDLQSTTLSNETKAHWIARMWSAEWQPFTSRLREYIVSPSKYCPGCDLPRQAWDCGADQQITNHIITECPLYRPPNGLHGLIDVDADAATREWLLSKFPEI